MNTTPESPKLPKSLVARLRVFKDTRIDRTKYHELIDVLVIALCTILCGGEGFNEMEDFGHAKIDWFQTFLKLPNGIPSHDTFNRVISALDPKQFMEVFIDWVADFRKTINKEIIALDGKALRRSIKAGQSLPYIVSAWSKSNGLVLGQIKVEEKSNEITAVPKLLKVLELSGCIVTLDAMGCQKKIARDIKKAKADYVLALKGNHGIAHEEVRDYFKDALENAPQELQSCETIEKGHGRIETRTCWVTQNLDWFQDRLEWDGLTSFVMVEAKRELPGKEPTSERRYYLSSLKDDARQHLAAVRDHWGVENQCHWVLDVQFGEDQCRARTGNAAENLAALRRLSLNILKQENSKKGRSLRIKQKTAGWDNPYLMKLLAL